MVGNILYTYCNSLEQSLEESEDPTITGTGVCNSFIEVNTTHTHTHTHRTVTYNRLHVAIEPYKDHFATLSVSYGDCATI